MNEQELGSIGSAEMKDRKPIVALEEGSSVDIFYRKVNSTSKHNIPQWTVGDCPWCFDTPTRTGGETGFTFKRTSIPLSGGKKIKDKNDLIVNFLAKAWHHRDGGFMLREFKRRIAVQQGSPSPIHRQMAVDFAEMTEMREDKSLYSSDPLNCLQSTYTTWNGRGTLDRSRYWKAPPKPKEKKKGGEESKEEKEREEEKEENEGGGDGS